MADNKIENDFGVEATFSGGHGCGLIYFAVKQNNLETGKVHDMHVFSASKKDSKFFREMADKLDSLPA